MSETYQIELQLRMAITGNRFIYEVEPTFMERVLQPLFTVDNGQPNMGGQPIGQFVPNPKFNPDAPWDAANNPTHLDAGMFNIRFEPHRPHEDEYDNPQDYENALEVFNSATEIVVHVRLARLVNNQDGESGMSNTILDQIESLYTQLDFRFSVAHNITNVTPRPNIRVQGGNL